ncbi:MAG: hypothetical protein JWQ27_2031 [Ferruginibacter sp.]|nr:hypothetical protein [Ferruginibacter sp.]
MKTRFLPAILIAMMALLMASCSKSSNKQGRYIPAKAAFVIHMNGSSLNEKLPWSDIKQNDFYKEIMADSSVDAYLKQALENPENTGVDVKDDLLMFIVKDTSGGYMAVEGKLKDAAKFKQFNSNAIKDVTAVDKDGLTYLKKDRMISSWNKDRFILIVDAPEMNTTKQYGRWNDSTVTLPVSTRDVLGTAKSLFDLSEDQSMAKNEKFSDLMNTKGDMHFWMSAENIDMSSLIMAMPGMNMLNLTKLYEGSILAATANFTNGQINVDMKSYSGKDMTALWKNYGGKNISSEMTERLPNKNIAAFFAMSFKPEGIKELLKLAGLDGYANLGAMKYNFTLDDFIKANKGDLLFAVSDIGKDSSGSPAADFIFSTSIGDKASFDKLVNVGKTLAGAAMSDKVFVNMNNNFFVVGNHQASVNKYIASSGNNKFPFLDKLTGNPIGGYINFQYILSTVKANMQQDSLQKASVDASLKLWDNLYITGGEFKNDAMVSHMEINLVDKSTNSLKQLNNYFLSMSRIQKSRMAMYKSDLSMDTSAVMVPRDSVR